MSTRPSHEKGRLDYELGRNPLPPVDGPKLKAFRYRKSKIEYLELLSIHPDRAAGSGGHAHVFKVRIEGEIFALKVFKFFTIKQGRREIFPQWNHEVDNEKFLFHIDPFFAECRAYGKIEEIQQRRRRTSRSRAVPQLAVPCYGYIGLRPEVEQTLREQFAIENWDRPAAQKALPFEKRAPFRAIVKQFVENLKPVVSPKKMLADLRILRAHGVYQQDVYARNYMNGLLVDFSVAWTDPHWCLDVMDEETLAIWKNDELHEFDQMMRDESVKTQVRAFRERDETTLGKLRSRKTKVDSE